MVSLDRRLNIIAGGRRFPVQPLGAPGQASNPPAQPGVSFWLWRARRATVGTDLKNVLGEKIRWDKSRVDRTSNWATEVAQTPTCAGADRRESANRQGLASHARRLRRWRSGPAGSRGRALVGSGPGISPLRRGRQLSAGAWGLDSW